MSPRLRLLLLDPKARKIIGSGGLRVGTIRLVSDAQTRSNTHLGTVTQSQ
jgi:hypothetical protein